MNELCRLSALELADAFRHGRATALDIVDAHLARMDAVNPAVNAVVRRNDDAVRAEARAQDARRAAGEACGPFSGVPMTVKENIDVAGMPTTYGLNALAGVLAKRDSPVVARMRAAGALIVGRTNLPDLGLRVHTHSGLHGLTRNPWTPARTVGGSSGGEAASLATGMSALGLGNDLGGSLRNPATCCSIASLKPTQGWLPHANDVHALPETLPLQLLMVEGAMARRVADVRAAVQVMGGPDGRDPWTVPATPPQAGSGPWRVALVAEPPGGDTDPRVAAVARAAADALARAGVHVAEVAPPRFDEVVACWHQIVVGGVSAARPMLAPVLSSDANAFLEAAATASGEIPPVAIDMAWVARRALAEAWIAFFSEWDAVLTPTWAQLPFVVGADIASPAGAAAALQGARAVLPANVLGLPSAAVPAGMVDGVPVGVLLTGPAWSDMTCLALAELIERAGLAPATPIDPRRT